MANDQMYIGKLNTIVEIVKFTGGQSTTGMDDRVETILGEVHAHRVPGTTGSEEEEGKIKWLSVRKYIIRHIDQILMDGVQMVIRDVDGDFEINHVDPVGRKRWLILKCSKRE